MFAFAMEVPIQMNGSLELPEEFDFDTESPDNHHTTTPDANPHTKDTNKDKGAPIADSTEYVIEAKHIHNDELLDESHDAVNGGDGEDQIAREDNFGLDQGYDSGAGVDDLTASLGEETIPSGAGIQEDEPSDPYDDFEEEHDQGEGQKVHDTNDLSYDEHAGDLLEQEEVSQQQVDCQHNDGKAEPASAGQNGMGDATENEDVSLFHDSGDGGAAGVTGDVYADPDAEQSRLHSDVKVVYHESDYSLCAQSEDDDPESFFIADVKMLNEPLSSLLSEIRAVIGDDVKAGHELHMRINGLGIEFQESTNPDFLENTTFQQVLDLYNRLLRQDDDEQIVTVYAYLSLKPTCLHQWATLSGAADEGKGFWNATSLLDDHSEDTSQYYDDDEILDNGVLDEDVQGVDGYDDAEFGVGSDATMVQELRDNPFATQPSNPVAQNDDHFENDTIEPGTATVDSIDHEAKLVSLASGLVEGDDDLTTGTKDPAEDYIDFSNEEGYPSTSAPSPVAQQGQDTPQPIKDDNLDLGEFGADEASATGPAAERDLLITHPNEGDQPHAGHELPDDEYLILDDVEDVAHNADAAKALTDLGSSSATIGTAPGLTSANVTPATASVEVVDEIDWDHDDDEEKKLGHDSAHQSPNSSPVSLSAKRSRQSDENDGVNGETDVKRRKI